MAAEPGPERTAPEAESLRQIELRVNGERERSLVSVRQLLVHFIRDTLGLRGTHIGCDTGNCGACTVICDGKAIKSCMQLAVQADGCEIRTVESLSAPGEPTNELQAAFNRNHGLQCGYCTPGFLMATTALLESGAELDRATIRRALKGNVCRCTGYINIVHAVEEAAGLPVQEEQGGSATEGASG